MRALALALIAILSNAALADDLAFRNNEVLGPKEAPTLIVTPSRAVALMEVEITFGDQTLRFEKQNLPGGKDVRFALPRDVNVTEATALLRADYPDGSVEGFEIPMRWSYNLPMSVDLSRAVADVSARTLKVKVSAPVQEADIVAYGAGKAVLDQRTVTVAGGPGEVEVPWVGDPGEVVLLDVTLRGGGSWAGFTYSPWFLDIPHEDVLFESDQAVIRPTEEYKLQATLQQLHDVVEKYGDMVPVKLYIGGCTDTMGSSEHNRELSRRRAQAIATWLRKNGYDKPIFYHGFGESWLAVPTGDEVDHGANRRAVYMVGANPPPAGAGVPGASWTPL